MSRLKSRLMARMVAAQENTVAISEQEVCCSNTMVMTTFSDEVRLDFNDKEAYNDNLDVSIDPLGKNGLETMELPCEPRNVLTSTETPDNTVSQVKTGNKHTQIGTTTVINDKKKKKKKKNVPESRNPIQSWTDVGIQTDDGIGDAKFAHNNSFEISFTEFTSQPEPKLGGNICADKSVDGDLPPGEGFQVGNSLTNYGGHDTNSKE